MHQRRLPPSQNSNGPGGGLLCLDPVVGEHFAHQIAESDTVLQVSPRSFAVEFHKPVQNIVQRSRLIVFQNTCARRGSRTAVPVVLDRVTEEFAGLDSSTHCTPTVT